MPRSTTKSVAPHKWLFKARFRAAAFGWRTRDFRQYQKEAFAGRGRAYTDDAKVAQLERQLGQVAAENIALKKALRRIKELARENGE